MGKKGGSQALKRKPAPRIWPIHKKEFTWTVRPTPGPHYMERCIPLAIMLREILGFAKTRKEAKIIVAQGKIYVDGKVRRDDRFPVGLMDVISIPDVGKTFRVLPHKKGLALFPIDEDEANFKLCRIENKTVVKGGHIQLNLHDGSNILIKVADAKNPQEDVYKTFDTIKVSLPERKILDHIPMREGVYAIITGGKNQGVFGRIVGIEKAEGKRRKDLLVTIEDDAGNRYQTILDFAFAIGEFQPLISLPKVAEVTQNA